MAHPWARAQQQAVARERLRTTAAAVAEAFGLDDPNIPVAHRDPYHLPTVQIEAVCDLLDALIEQAPAKKAATKDEKVDAPVKAKVA